MIRFTPKLAVPVTITRELDRPVEAAAIAVALRLAERGVRCHGQRGSWLEVVSVDGLRAVRFTIRRDGSVDVRHTVSEWVECGRLADRWRQRYGTARYTELAAGDALAVRAVAAIRALPEDGGPDSHGS